MRYLSNIWGPHNQPGEVDFIQKHYGFSPRLHAIIQETPLPRRDNKPVSRHRHRFRHSEDVEMGRMDLGTRIIMNHEDATHYNISEQMTNYHAIDFGEKCNFMNILTY